MEPINEADIDTVARDAVTSSITTAVAKARTNSGKEKGELLNKTVTLKPPYSDEESDEIEEEIVETNGKHSKLNKSDITRDSLEEDRRSSCSSSSSSSSHSSSSSSTSTSSGSSQHPARPARLAQTFRKQDLSSELNRTRVIQSNGRRSGSPPRVTSGSLAARRSSPKVSSWIDPKSVKGTKNDEKKIKEWISNKETLRKKEIIAERKQRTEKEKQLREEEEQKVLLQKKRTLICGKVRRKLFLKRR